MDQWNISYNIIHLCINQHTIIKLQQIKKIKGVSTIGLAKNNTMDKQDNIDYEDSESYSGGDKNIGIKEISLRLFQKAVMEGSKEMTQGGVFKRIIDGQLIEYSVPNQVEIFCNSVEMFYYAMQPYVARGGEEFKTQIKELLEQLIEAEKDYKEDVTAIKSQTKNISEGYLSSNGINIADISNSVKIRFNKYENTKIKLRKDQLALLSELLSKLNYFEEGGMIP